MVCVLNEPQRKVDQVVSRTFTIRQKVPPLPYHYEISCKRRSDSPEMTLIATAWSLEGFAIAADGLEILTNPTRIEDVQKIFSTPFANETGFAWAWVGDVAVNFTSGHRFDLKEITQSVMASVQYDALLDSPKDYFDKIAFRIHFELSKDLNPSDLADGAEVIFVGYLNGKPLWTEIIFQCRDGQFFPPVVTEPRVEPRNFYAFSGSQTISREMQVAGKLSAPYHLNEAIDSVRTYAEVCIGSCGKVEDCRNFGGTAHIATVTKEGFTWINKPKTLKTSR